MRSAHFSFFQNRECEYFPCHEIENEEDFNCLFCYCPLYALGEKCGGNYRYLDGHVKDCSQCLIPHKRRNFAYVTKRYNEIVELVKKVDGQA